MADQNTNDLSQRKRYGDHKAERLSNVSWLVLSAIRRLADCLMLGSLTRECLPEYCNLPRHIAVPRESKLCLYTLRLGHSQENHIHRLGNERSLACKRDMQDIAVFFRPAILPGLRVPPQGWQRGAGWAFDETRILDVGTSPKVKRH